MQTPQAHCHWQKTWPGLPIEFSTLHTFPLQSHRHYREAQKVSLGLEALSLFEPATCNNTNLVSINVMKLNVKVVLMLFSMYRQKGTGISSVRVTVLKILCVW